jgi:hypothetical protein
MAVSRGLGSVTPVEQGGTERFDLGHGLLVGNGQLPVLTLSPSTDGYPAYVNGEWVIVAGSPGGGGVPTGGETALPTGVLKSDGATILEAIANVDYLTPDFTVDGGVF